MEEQWGPDFQNLSQNVAKEIIKSVGESGIPPETGFQYFTVGLDPYLKILDEEYLSSYIKEGGNSFKLIQASYGGGKTHFLYYIRELGWKHNYVVSYITLSPNETPFYKLEKVYSTIAKSLVYPLKPEEVLGGYNNKGIEALISKWYKEQYVKYMERFNNDIGKTVEEIENNIKNLPNFESISFSNAIKKVILSLLHEKQEDATLILQWLMGENPPKSELKKFGIYEKIDNTTAFKMIRSLTQFIKDVLKYSGLIILMDEAEQTPSMSSKQKTLLLNNLREVIDECSQHNLKNTMWFYAVPDMSWLEGKKQIYIALSQRLKPVLGEFNPSGVKIDLDELAENSDEEKMNRSIGEKLYKIYERAYGISFDKTEVNNAIDKALETAQEEKFLAGEKRAFVQSLIKEFHVMRIHRYKK